MPFRMLYRPSLLRIIGHPHQFFFTDLIFRFPNNTYHFVRFICGFYFTPGINRQWRWWWLLILVEFIKLGEINLLIRKYGSRAPESTSCKHKNSGGLRGRFGIGQRAVIIICFLISTPRSMVS